MGFVALGFASCVSDKEVNTQTQDQKYQAAFENLVGGKINASVNWGFNDQQVVTFDSEGKFAGMRGVYPNANQYGMYINVPTEMTQAQKDKVTKYFTEVKNPAGISVNWSDFFVHNVSSTDKGPSMNQLICGANDLSNSDHVLNFNSGSSTSSKNVGIEPIDANNARQVNYYDGIQLCQNSSTEFFSFHNSYDSKTYSNNFVMVTGEMIDAAISDGPSVAGMWFVGFDYQHSIDGRVEDRDYYFNDWIIRVSPGFYKNAQRVMVEDLVASDLSQVGYTNGKSDWDFNDAVFDVAFVDDDAVITLWAAGGTKSLTIGGKEVHELFGKPVSTMINTNATGGVDGLAPVIFRIPNVGTKNAKDILVKVGSTELKAETGKAPQKVEVSTSTRWMKEMMIITSSYADFATYATTASPANWYENASNTGNLY
jgi:hypothetical protein